MSGRAWVAVGVAAAVAAFIVYQRKREADAPDRVLEQGADATADALGQVRDAAASAWDFLSTTAGGWSWPSFTSTPKPPEHTPT